MEVADPGVMPVERRKEPACPTCKTEGRLAPRWRAGRRAPNAFGSVALPADLFMTLLKELPPFEVG